MKTTVALSLGARLVAFMWSLRAIVYLPTFVWSLATLAEPKRWPFAVSSGSAFALSLAAAWLLFRYADVLAVRFGSSDDEIDLRQWPDYSYRRGVFLLAL